MNILLLRNQAEAALSKQNILASLPFYKVDIAPLFELVDYALPNLPLGAALITTSKNAIKILAQNSKAKDYPLFVVGDASAEYAAKLGFTNIHTAQGHAQSLAALINHQSDYQDFIYLRGADIRFPLKQQIHKNITEYITYGLKAIDTPFAHLPPRYFEQSPIIFIYSENQAKATLAALPYKHNIRIIAISRAAAVPFIKKGYTNIRIAPKPSEQAMIALVTE